MDLSIFNDKKILFYGPAKTKDKSTLDLDHFDYIIITNNMIDIFFKKYGKPKTYKVIHLCNRLYEKTNSDVIKKYIDNIDIILTSQSKETLKTILNEHVDKIFWVGHKPSIIIGTPLGLTRILSFLKTAKFKELYITGVTFYSEKNIEQAYEDKNYKIKQGDKFNVFNKDKHKHNIKSNIEYTKNICKNNSNILICNELHKILFSPNKKKVN